MIDPRDFGAIGDGQHDDTQALQAAINEAKSRNGGCVTLRNGTFLSGSLELCSHLHLRIEAGATLQGSSRADAYRAFASETISRMDAQPWRAFLFAQNCEFIRIDGGGTINAGGDSDELRDGVENSPFRPYGLHIVSCKNTTVQDLKLRNSAFWMQRYFNCDGVRLNGLHVLNHANKNNDGIDIDSSQNVQISDCFIDASDDGICLKSEGEACCQNVTVTNCIVGSHATGIKLGTGSVGGFRNITVSNCVIRRSQATEMHHPSQMWGGISGIDLLTVDGGALENVCITNITIEDVAVPLVVWLGNRNSGNVKRQGYGGTGDSLQGASGDAEANIQYDNRLEGVTISNIVARNVGPYASFISGFADHPATNVSLSNISIYNGVAATAEEAAKTPARDPASYPGGKGYGCFLPASGLYLDNAEHIQLDNVRVYPAEGDERPGVVCNEVNELSYERLFCANGQAIANNNA